MTGTLISKPCEDTDTLLCTHRGRRACEDGGRDWSNTAKCQGTPRITCHHQGLREKYGTVSPLEPSEGAWPVDSLISDF